MLEGFKNFYKTSTGEIWLVITSPNETIQELLKDISLFVNKGLKCSQIILDTQIWSSHDFSNNDKMTLNNFVKTSSLLRNYIALQFVNNDFVKYLTTSVLRFSTNIEKFAFDYNIWNIYKYSNFITRNKFTLRYFETKFEHSQEGYLINSLKQCMHLKVAIINGNKYKHSFIEYRECVRKSIITFLCIGNKYFKYIQKDIWKLIAQYIWWNWPPI